MKGEKPSKRPLLGAHMSIAGGIDKALALGARLGCEAVQIFTRSSRQWASRPYRGEEIEAFFRTRERSGVRLVVAHDSYLFNLASPGARLRRRSVRGFIDELERCETLRLPYLIAHPGAHMGEGEREGILTVARSLDEIHRACAGYRARIALEITAGQGSSLGYRFEQIREILERVREPERLAVCFDTQHAFAAGYDLASDEGYEKTFAEFDETIGLERLVAFHLNDSKKGAGCRVDRHEHIGKGRIGLGLFRRLLNDRRFAGLPMCLETPKGPDLKEDEENLAVLRSLLPRRYGASRQSEKVPLAGAAD
jgi:deoxyribonuclease-4